MKHPKTGEKLFSNRKTWFWVGHSLFWVTIGIGSNFVNNSVVKSFCELGLLIIMIVSGFLTFYPLRYIYKKYNCHRYNLFLLIPLVTACSIFAGSLWTYSQIFIYYLINGTPLILNPFLISRSLYLNSFAGFLWSSLYLGYKIWEEWNDQKYQLEHERTLLKTSQLEMLKYQLNPHFLFNSLSSLRGLITVDQVKAKSMVTQISEFLRYSLLEGKNNEVPLIKEIEIIKQYLSIEQVRYNEDLIVEFDISPETNDFMIPIFLIHPLVENAVKHGMQTSALPLKVSVHSEIRDSALIVEVKNSGSWIGNDKKVDAAGTGIGLQNIKKRLEHSFPNSHLFEIKKGIDFVNVVITIYAQTE